MGFGSSPFGSMPFGTTFTEPVFSPEIKYVEYLAKDLLKVNLSEEVIVNSDYLSSSSYSIVDSLNNRIPVLAVIKTNTIALSYVLLKTNPQLEGQTYTLTVSRLVGRTGLVISAPDNVASWVYYRTKGDGIIASMPDMYDMSAGSNLRSILQAIANEDNTVGGSASGVEEE